MIYSDYEINKGGWYADEVSIHKHRVLHTRPLDLPEHYRLFLGTIPEGYETISYLRSESVSHTTTRRPRIELPGEYSYLFFDGRIMDGIYLSTLSFRTSTSEFYLRTRSYTRELEL